MTRRLAAAMLFGFGAAALLLGLAPSPAAADHTGAGDQAEGACAVHIDNANSRYYGRCHGIDPATSLVSLQVLTDGGLQEMSIPGPSFGGSMWWDGSAAADGDDWLWDVNPAGDATFSDWFGGPIGSLSETDPDRIRWYDAAELYHPVVACIDSDPCAGPPTTTTTTTEPPTTTTEPPQLMTHQDAVELHESVKLGFGLLCLCGGILVGRRA